MRHGGALLGPRLRGGEVIGSDAPDYLDFIRSKIITLPPLGLPIAAGDVHPALKPHQAALVRWMVEGGRRACFAAFGLGKSLIQLETMRQIGRQLGGRQLIVVPLTVVVEFKRDAALLGIEPVFIKSTAGLEAETRTPALSPEGRGRLYLTNYESVREGKIDLALFNAASLDEASCLRGFGGTKTFREFMKLFDGMRYKFVATATPSPNEYLELLAYAAFLEVMDVGQAKTRFFKRDSQNADHLTLHPHKQDEFWLWVNSWAAFVQRPSDLGFSDEGYVLPELDVRWHEVASDHAAAGALACPVARCSGVRAARWETVCPACWRRLPAAMRGAIGAARRARAAHRVAAAEMTAVAWLDAHPVAERIARVCGEAE